MVKQVLICDTCDKEIEDGQYVTIVTANNPNKDGTMTLENISNPVRHYHAGCVRITPLTKEFIHQESLKAKGARLGFGG